MKLTPYEAYIKKYNGRLPTERDPRYLELLNMSKYVVQDAPNSQPGKCANCGASKNDGRKYIDFGLYVNWYGTVVLCGLCLTDIADNMGLFDYYKNKIEEITNEALKREKLQEQATFVVADVVGAMEGVKDYLTNVHSINDDLGVNSSADVGVDSTANESANESENNSTVNESKSRTTKSNSSRRSADVPSLASLLDTNSK